MLATFLQSKIAHAVVTEAELFYEGSISIDSDLMKAVGILPSQQVEVLNINNGNRFTTYTIEAKAGSGKICLNGPAARLGVVGDQIIILSYVSLDEAEIKDHQPKVIHCNEDNTIKS